MDQVEVRIKGNPITAQYGSLNDGDILKCSPEFAKHLVEQANAAEYIEAKKSEPKPEEEKPKPAAKTKK